MKELNKSIQDKQSALNQISKAYSIFVIEAKTGDNKQLENFFSEVETSMAFTDPKDRNILHDLEISVRQGTYLRHEDDFYAARDSILDSIASDKLKIYRMTTSKTYRFCVFAKKLFIRILASLKTKAKESKQHKE